MNAVLVKGSHGMQMEKVVDTLVAMPRVTPPSCSEVRLHGPTVHSFPPHDYDLKIKNGMLKDNVFQISTWIDCLVSSRHQKGTMPTQKVSNPRPLGEKQQSMMSVSFCWQFEQKPGKLG
ncbi:hypothetical protein V6N11_028114 [Hibiscus sabdariffa]|uniref:Uncharacterized protein n=1 Tax=Hibiscus sabdariffa TaxID=183260 RepID=A0ABR2P0E2_9ROSI